MILSLRGAFGDEAIQKTGSPRHNVPRDDIKAIVCKILIRI